MNSRQALILILLSCVLLSGSAPAAAESACAQEAQPGRTRLAVLDFGETPVGPRVADALAHALSDNGASLAGSAADFKLVDREAVRAAARGAGYAGSLNLTLKEARDLGAAIGCDFFITGDAQVLRRSPSTGPIYYEAYASIFAVSARSGRLLWWERPAFEAQSPEDALKALLAQLSKTELRRRYLSSLRATLEAERQRAAASVDAPAARIEEAPAEADAADASLRLPQPYRRLRPAYPEAAARAEAEASVDVLVDLDREGEVTRVEVVRWAGFGLDEETVKTVRQLHFRPAMRDGTPLPMRVLLRYNFRKPKKEEKR